MFLRDIVAKRIRLESIKIAQHVMDIDCREDLNVVVLYRIIEAGFSGKFIRDPTSDFFLEASRIL